MTKLSKDRVIGTLHPRENLVITGILGAINSEVVLDADGCATVAVDLRGTFSETIEISGSINGTDWIVIPVRSQAGGSYLAAIVGTTSGIWMASCVGFNKVRARVTAYTSGGATVTLSASTALFGDSAKNGVVTSSIGTVTAAVGVAATLTLAAPGAGLRQYLTYLSMNRINGTVAALTASATPVVCTTTNLPGTLAFTRAADALPAGAADLWREDFAYPIMATAQNTAVTIVCPATTGVIWRITAGYYVGP